MKGICKKSGKRRFPTHEKAMTRAGEILDMKRSAVKTWRSYHCPHCDGWHLTTK